MLNRQHDNKEDILVVDNVDGTFPMLARKPDHVLLASSPPPIASTFGRGFLSMIGFLTAGAVVGASWSHWIG
jgi:hypothetical protein